MTLQCIRIRLHVYVFDPISAVLQAYYVLTALITSWPRLYQVVTAFT